MEFKVRSVCQKHHKYVVQSAICDKKVEIERAKLVEQAKNIAKPREKNYLKKWLLQKEKTVQV